MNGRPVKVRWNTRAKVWQFWNKAWGGWCVLRQTPSNESAPMGYAEGFAHVAARLNRPFDPYVLR